jgi:hypothetical protein
MRSTSVARTWGSTQAERDSSFACDRHLSRLDDCYLRAIDVDAPTAILFRWLCQLRVAPYSYDWIDNFGRRSPRELIPGLDDLAIGQRVMGIFKLVEFERDRHLTVLTRPPARLTQVAVTYRLDPVDDGRCRLVVKLALRYAGGRATAWLFGRLWPWLELFMMQRQLRTLKQLAEAQAR